MEYLLKLLEQENEGKAFKLFIKIVFWINCVGLCIWLSEQLGYEIQTVSFELGTLIKLFSQHFLIAGLTSFVIITTLFTLFIAFVSDIMARRLSNHDTYTNQIVDYKSKRKFIRTVFQSSSEIEKYLLENPNFDEEIYSIKMREIDQDNDVERTMDNLTKLMISTTLVYVTIIRLKFPLMHFFLIDVFLFLVSYFLLIRNGEGLFEKRLAEFIKVKDKLALKTNDK
jgi:hypothetical protein